MRKIIISSTCDSNEYISIDFGCVLASLCPVNSYADLTTKICEKCPTLSNCAQCKKVSECAVCNSGFLLTPSFSCVDSQSCPEGTFADIN